MTVVLIVDSAPHNISHYAQSGCDLGYRVQAASDCASALRVFEQLNPDVVIVGRLSGEWLRFDFCRQLRSMAPAGRCGIVVLVPASAELSRIRCLEEGADAVVEDNVTPSRLWSRIAAILAPRRIQPQSQRLQYGKFDMAVEEHKVFVAGSPVALSLTSFSILGLFLERPERILTRKEISTMLGRAGMHQERTIDVHIRNLRLALKPAAAEGSIVTVPLFGYMLCDCTLCDCHAVATTVRTQVTAQ